MKWRCIPVGFGKFYCKHNIGSNRQYIQAPVFILHICNAYIPTYMATKQLNIRLLFVYFQSICVNICVKGMLTSHTNIYTRPHTHTPTFEYILAIRRHTTGDSGTHIPLNFIFLLCHLCVYIYRVCKVLVGEWSYRLGAHAFFQSFSHHFTFVCIC